MKNTLLSSFMFIFFILFTFSLQTQAVDWNSYDWDDVVDGDGLNKDFSSDEAKRIAENVMLYQRNSGGWPKNTQMQLVLSSSDKDDINDDKSSKGTIDNKATKLELEYLSNVYKAISDESLKAKIKTSFLNGVQFLLDMQYSNGGFPQFYPNADGYNKQITYNDGAMINAIKILEHINNKDNEYSILADDNMVAEAGKAVEKGTECILNTQYVQNGTLTVWCAQHDYQSLKPTKARAYELASLSGGESGSIIEFLMTINSPSFEIRKAVYYGVKWYDENRIVGISVVDYVNSDGDDDTKLVDDPSAEDRWGRFNTLNNSTLFFSDRDGEKYYDFEDISLERQTGYGWFSTSGKDVIKKYDSWKNVWGANIEAEMNAGSGDSYAITVKDGFGDGNYAEGSVITVIADNPQSGFAFGNWTGDVSYLDDANASKTIISMPSKNISITANYIAAEAYQAEYAILGTGAEIDNNHFGHNGTGFVNFELDNSFLEFQNVDGGDGGNTSLTFRYALSNTDRTGNLIINGESQTFTMISTGGWDIWGSTDVNVSLNAGRNNVIRLETTGQDFGNLDEISIGDNSGSPKPISYVLTISNGSGSGSFESGSSISVSANDAPLNQVFDKWTGDVSNISNVYAINTSIIMPANSINITANYINVGTPTIAQVLNINSGSGSGAYLVGHQINIIADAATSGMVFDKWIGDIENLTDEYSSSTTLIMPSKQTTIMAVFKVDNNATSIAENNTGITTNCYPNPFSESTTIRFSLEEASEVNFALYNLAGVQVLNINNQYTIGSHELTISRNNLKSGNYLLKLNTENNTEVIRLLVK